jgi:hypothetical protein
MRLELSETQCAVLRPLVRDAEGMHKPETVIAQVMPGDWRAPGSLWLIYTTISKATAKKIRKLIDKDHAQKTQETENGILKKNLCEGV